MTHLEFNKIIGAFLTTLYPTAILVLGVFIVGIPLIFSKEPTTPEQAKREQFAGYFWDLSSILLITTLLLLPVLQFLWRTSHIWWSQLQNS